MRRLAALLIACFALIILITVVHVPSAEAAGNSKVWIVTWDYRTVYSGKAFAESDNKITYEAPLTIHFENVTSMRVRFLDGNGKVVGGQDRNYVLTTGRGSVSYSCSVPAGSRPGTYKVRIDAKNGKKSSTYTFTWKVTKYVYSATPSASMQQKINYLKNKLPNGKYWNHGVKGVTTVYLDNGRTTTISSSRCNSWSHKGENFRSSSATCNYSGNGYQCHGFAMILAEYTWGGMPRESSKTYDRSVVDRLEPGDVVRYLNDEHTIFVLRVEKDTVYFAECNNGGTCKINWNGKISVSSLKKTFTYCYRYSMR